MNVLGRGVYTVAEAARLTKLRGRRVREWFRGRQSPNRIFRPVFQSDYPVLDQEFAISFLDLIELNIAGKLRERVSLAILRKSYHHLRREFGDHPFCRRQVYVGGKQIFTTGLDDAESDGFLEAMTDQLYFETVIRPFLTRIDYDDATKQAARWNIADLVVVDPRFRFGKPVVEQTGISTTVLSRSYHANGADADRVAKWFAVEPRHVMAAVAFENSLAA